MELVTIAWHTERGGVSMERISPTELPERIRKLFKRRLEAVAWFEPNRDEPVAGIQQDSDGKWMWWYDNDVVKQ